MDIHINQKPLSLPEGATVADALAAFGARPPFAVALNGDSSRARCTRRARCARATSSISCNPSQAAEPPHTATGKD